MHFQSGLVPNRFNLILPQAVADLHAVVFSSSVFAASEGVVIPAEVSDYHPPAVQLDGTESEIARKFFQCMVDFPGSFIRMLFIPDVMVAGNEKTAVI